MLILFMAGMENCAAQATTAKTANEIRLAEIQGKVEILPRGATIWASARPNQILHPFDRVLTAKNSRIAVRWSNQSVISFGASTELEILPPRSPDEQAGLHLIKGVISFFHRDKPGLIHIITDGAQAGVEGTEFVLAVNDARATTLSVIDGKVKFWNARATLVLTNGEQAIAEFGRAPRRTAGFIANNLLQWCFYYPAVIDPDELQLTAGEQKDLAESLAAYRSGDLPVALEKYPAGRTGVSDREKIYHAALLLSVGEVKEAETALSAVTTHSGRLQELVDSLRLLIAAVKRQTAVSVGTPQLASELLAESYYEQSRALGDISLKKALQLARRSATISPKFGFAWERVAELEFSFGRWKDALKDLDKSLDLAPRNAQALALKGFILNAQNRPRPALQWFDRSIATDSALGNAWLGRGLARIRLGDMDGGREDLLVAAALEPQRAELRSYLGKAYAATGDDFRAQKELRLAKKLDPNDPTAWLYSALLNQQENRINDAIRDLEKSQSLNDNRSVYRSQLLLDEDRATRSANLASIYHDAGMNDVSLQEAGRAVSSDYANYSGHIFLANSYEQMRDPNWSNLRYETPAVSEFWIANLLAPVGAGWQSEILDQQPYSNLFERNRFGVASDTTYLSRGAWTEEGSQFGTFDNFTYSLDAKYLYDPGQRPNNDNEHRDLTLNLKYQFTPQDSVFVSVEQDQIDSGDVSEYYGPSSASPDFRVSEDQNPNLYFGYHHEWSPGVHTLFLGSRGYADETASANNWGQYIGVIEGGVLAAILQTGNIERVKASTTEYSTELQQIWEQPHHTTIIGAKYDWGRTRYQNYEFDTGGTPYAVAFFPTAPVYGLEDFSQDFHQFSVYGYHSWQLADSLTLTAGLSYDWIHQPADVAAPPFPTNNAVKTTVQFSPKVGFIWTPAAHTTLRAAYTRSLSGFIDEQSIRLEPTEVAGFNQAFRSLMPESVVGDSSGSRFDTYDVSLEQKFDTGTYLSLSGDLLYSRLNNIYGAWIYNYDLAVGTIQYPTYPTGFNQSLHYREWSLLFTADQLLGRQWSVGARYRLSQAQLERSYPDINPANLFLVQGPFQQSQSLNSVLQTVNLHANWNHPSGLFAILEANWYHQNNSGFSPVEPGDDFWQFNVYAGYRFWHRKAEFTIGLLNLTDQNYRLEPLNLYNEMTHGRTLLARLRFNF